MLTQMDVLGAWVSIFLTVCILSFLYEDNPVYKLAEHLFLGVSIAIGIIEGYFGTFKPNMIDHLAEGRLLSLVPLVLIVLLFAKLVPKLDWLARIPIAFIVAVYAGVKLTGEANANLMTPISSSMVDFAQLYRDYGWYSASDDYAGVISGVVLVVGLCATLLHFYFSAAHNRPLRVVSRVGVLTLMLSFGASFGYTVMGRISLAIGRTQELIGIGPTAEQVAQIQPRLATLASVAIVVLIIGGWKAMNRDREPEPGAQAGARRPERR